MEKTRDMCVTLAASPAHTCTITLKDGAVTTTTLRGKGLPVQTRIDFSGRPEKAMVRAFLNQVKDTLSDGKFAVVSSVGVVEEDAREAGVIAMLRRHKLQFAPAVADPSDLPAGAAAPPPPETARPWTLFLRKVSAVMKEAAKSGVDAAVRSVATDGKTISQFASRLRKLKSTDEWTDADILAALPSFLLSRASETPTAVDSAKSEVEHRGDGDEGKSSESSEGEEDPGQADPGQADPGQADPGQADPGQADPGQADKEKKPEESGEDAGNQTSSTRAALSAAQASCAHFLALQAAARDAEQDSERALDLARGKDAQAAAAVVAARERLDQTLLEAKAIKDARAQARASYESRKRDSCALAEQVCAAQAILFSAEKALADAEAAAAAAAAPDRADRAKGGAEGAKASPGSGAGAGAGGAGGGSGSVPTHERRKHIPKHVKTLVWNKYVGEEAAVATCTCCRAAQISVRSFHCEHVIAEAAGGGVTLNNLRPICAACNGSMGVRSMNEFTSEFFGWALE